MRHLKAALLDVDGTLVDSNYHHVIAWQRALADVGVSVSATTLHAQVGKGGDRFVAAVAGDDAEQLHGDDARYLHGRYYEELMPLLQPLPGAAELVHELRNRGLDVVLASSSEPHEVERHMEVVGITCDDVVAVVSRGDVDSSKPAPDVFGAALQKVAREPHEAFAVGDTVWDLEAARALSLPVIGVLSGGISPQLLRSAGAIDVRHGPAAVAADLDELLPAIESYIESHGITA